MLEEMWFIEYTYEDDGDEYIARGSVVEYLGIGLALVEFYDWATGERIETRVVDFTGGDFWFFDDQEEMLDWIDDNFEDEDEYFS